MAITSLTFQKQVFAPASTFGGTFIIGDKVHSLNSGSTVVYNYTYPDLTSISSVTITSSGAYAYGTDEFNKKIYGLKSDGLYEFNPLTGVMTLLLNFNASGQVDYYTYNQCAVHTGLKLIAFIGYLDNRLAFFDLTNGTLLANINHGVGSTTFLSFAYKRLFTKARNGPIYSSPIITRSNLSSLTFSIESGTTSALNGDLPSGSFHQKYGKVVTGGYSTGSVNIYDVTTDYQLDQSNLFLFKTGSNVSTHNGTTLEVIGTYPPTKENFTTSNMTSITTLDKTILSQVDDVLVYNEDSTCNINITPTQNKVIIKSNSTSLSEVENIDSISMTSASNVKFFISPNKGITWHSYHNDAWNEHTLTIENLETYGMDSVLFNNLNDKFNSLLLNGGSLSFAFLLSSSDSNVDSIVFQSDLKGTWNGTADETSSQKNFKITYSSNENIKISFYVSGTYKVTY